MRPAPWEAFRAAVLLRQADGEWREPARSPEGFYRVRELLTRVPELDESGVEAFELR